MAYKNTNFLAITNLKTFASSLFISYSSKKLLKYLLISKTKAKHIIPKILDSITVFEYFFKKNFVFFFKQNFFNFTFLSFMHRLHDIVYANKLFTNYINFFIFIFSLFLFYKNVQLIYNFFNVFFLKRSFKTQKRLHHILHYFFKNITKDDLQDFYLNGVLFKLKGKFTKRAGDRRKKFYYKIGNYSITNPLDLFFVYYKQLWNKSGSTGFTIILSINRFKSNLIIH